MDEVHRGGSGLVRYLTTSCAHAIESLHHAEAVTLHHHVLDPREGERCGEADGILACGVSMTGLRSRDGQLDRLLPSSPRGEEKMGRCANDRWTAWV